MTLFQLHGLYSIEWYNDCERLIGKEVAVAHFKVLSALPGENSENHEQFQSLCCRSLDRDWNPGASEC
jgi:hypothetical protein